MCIRDSFYTYFEDKDDLLQYLVSGFREKCREQVYAQLELNQGDLFETACAMMEQIMDAGNESRGAELYRNALTELNPVTQSRMMGIKGFLYEDEVYCQFIHGLYERIDSARYPVGSEAQLACLVEIILVLVIKAVTMFYMGAAAVSDTHLADLYEYHKGRDKIEQAVEILKENHLNVFRDR